VPRALTDSPLASALARAQRNTGTVRYDLPRSDAGSRFFGRSERPDEDAPYCLINRGEAWVLVAEGRD